MLPDLPATRKCRPAASLRSRFLPPPTSDRRGGLRPGSNLFQARRRTLRRNPVRHAQDQELRPRMAPALQKIVPFSTERIAVSASAASRQRMRSSGTSRSRLVCFGPLVSLVLFGRTFLSIFYLIVNQRA